MIPGTPSRTALRVAVHRAVHQVLDVPTVFADPLALDVLGAERAAAIRANPRAAARGRVSKYIRAFVVARSRMAEDALGAAVGAGVRQYVVLGAGLDTFAYRNRHRAAGLRVFEVDHPATHAWKRRRLLAAGIDVPEDVAFVPIDFERQRLTDELVRAGLDRTAPTFFSWLGVTPYLERDAVLATLRDIAGLARRGGGVVFDYGLARSHLGIWPRILLRLMSARVRRIGEPLRTFFEPEELAAELRALGFHAIRQADQTAINARYFAGRSDGLRVGTLARLVAAWIGETGLENPRSSCLDDGWPLVRRCATSAQGNRGPYGSRISSKELAMDDRDLDAPHNAEHTTPGDPPADTGLSRREFVRTTAMAAGAGLMIVPRRVLGQGMTPPSDLVNIATVGINGQGGADTQNVMSQNIVAICDIDDSLLDKRLEGWQKAAAAPPATRRPARSQPESAWKDFGPSKAQLTANEKWPLMPQQEAIQRFVNEQVPKLKRYRDYREMLDKQKDIDGVIVATPDHMHAIIAAAAMDAGKHVYVQKPLCWSVQEARFLAKKAADKPKLVTQMGNQGHSGDGARRGQEYLLANAIGDIREVHVWTNRPLGYWPQGVPRPAPLLETPAALQWNNAGVDNRLAAAMFANYPVPDTLAWNLFLGGAPDVTYHPVYHPFNWRGWVDWGQGALGDMGAHLIDHPVWGLQLGYPTTIETVSTPFNGVTYPHATTTYYEFAAANGRPAVSMSWCDGGLLPERPAELGDEHLNADGGVLYIGSKGKLLQNTYGERPRLLPAELHNSFGPPPEKLPRIPHEAHEMNWVNAIRGRDQISCPFSYATHLTEIMLLGVVALRANAKIAYEGEHMRVTNHPEANEFLSRKYQHGYSLG